MAVTATLAQHILETRRLLHDATGTYWQDDVLTAFVNRAILQRDRDSGMNRAIVHKTITVGDAFYDLLVDIDPNAYDLLSIIVQDGNARYPLAHRSYTETTTYSQTSTTLSGNPECYARIGATTIYLAPIPNRALVTEWDVLRVAPALAMSGDLDPLPYPWTDPVPFLAAAFAKIALQQLDESRFFEGIYRERLAAALAHSQTRLMPVPYGGIER